MLSIFKTKRRKQLEAKERELYILKNNIRQMRHWCAADSGEIGCAMLHLEKADMTIGEFRDKLRQGEYTFEEYKRLDYLKGERAWKEKFGGGTK